MIEKSFRLLFYLKTIKKPEAPEPSDRLFKDYRRQ